MSMNRERRILTDFIELYHDFPCLWNTEIESYKDKIERDMAWDLLADKLKELEPRANVATAKKKIEHMRTAYMREYKRVLLSKQEDPSKHRIPTLWYYNLLSFMQPKDDASASEDDSYQYGDNSDDEAPQTSRDRNQEKIMKRKRNSDLTLEGTKKELMKTVQEIIQTAKNPPNSFGVYVGEQLLQIDNFQRQVAEKLISDVIFLAKTGKLDFDSTVITTKLDVDIPPCEMPASSPCDIKPSMSPELTLPCSSESSRASSPAQYIKLSLSPEPSPPASPQKMSPSPKIKSPSTEVIVQKSSDQTDVSTSQQTPSTLNQVLWCSPSTKIIQTPSTIKKIRLSPSSRNIQSCPVKVIKSDKTPKIVLSSSDLKKFRLSTNSSQPSSSKIVLSSPPKNIIESPSWAKKMRLSSPKSLSSNCKEIGTASENCNTPKLKEILLNKPNIVRK